MATITDELLDRLGDELLSLASFTRRQLQSDDRACDEELAHMLREIAVDRPTLARFADLLVRHETKQAALAELIALSSLTPAVSA